MKMRFLLLLLLPIVMFSQHTIKGTFSPASEFTYAFLYHATPSATEYVTRGEVDSEGNFTISLDSTAQAGIYKIVYAIPPEDNNFDLIYNGKENIALSFDLEKGLEFTESGENKMWSSYTNSMDMVNQTISNYYSQESSDKKAFQEIFKTLKETQKAFEEASKGTMAATFIQGNTPYMPEGYEDISTYSSNLKRTFLDHVDFNNELLQSSDFIIDRVMAYIFGMNGASSNEQYRKDVDNVISKIGEGELELKTLLMQMVWDQFRTSNNHDMANYVIDTYLMDLSKATKFDLLTEALTAYKNNAVGNKAQNFDIEIQEGKNSVQTSLHGLNTSEQYLVVFWSSTCGHCLEELPKLKTLMDVNTTTKVITIGLEDAAADWENLIKDYPNFIHVLGLGKWDNPISNAYNVSSTPSFFLLDKDKTIIAKPNDVAELDKILN